MIQHDVMNAIETGMDVYDSTENNMGSVLFLYMGGTQNKVDEDNLPSNATKDIRETLLREGYIRIGMAIFSGGSYAKASDIDRVEDGNVYLKIKQNEVVRD